MPSATVCLVLAIVMMPARIGPMHGVQPKANASRERGRRRGRAVSERYGIAYLYRAR